MKLHSRSFLGSAALATLLTLTVAGPAPAQLVLPYLPELDDVPTYVFSHAGFVDSAAPNSLVRLRVDGAYDVNRPTRAEFLLPPDGRGHRGLPVPERRIDYQEIHAYAEYAFSPIVSASIDAPTRFLNPEFNSNTSGPGDLQLAVKYAFFQQGPLTSSVQLRAYVPTGTPSSGLGTGHPSLEPGLLFLYQGDPKWRVEGEFLTWVPINDQGYGSEVLRYGLAFSYGERAPDVLWLTPVAELQGWTSIRGRETVAVSRRRSSVVRATSDTIVNGNLGVRAGLGLLGDVFIGYSRALTGEVWYKDLWRVELRYFF